MADQVCEVGSRARPAYLAATFNLLGSLAQEEFITRLQIASPNISWWEASMPRNLQLKEE
jgi:hypothetical protein